MEITDIKVKPLQGYPRLKAIVSITLDNQLIINDIKLIETGNKTVIDFPKDTFARIHNKESFVPVPKLRKTLEAAAVKAYQESIGGQKMCKTIVITNQKGGVAKTTTAANMGYLLAQNGFRVLLVDFDPQGNLTATSTTQKAPLSVSDILQIMVKEEPLPELSQFIGKAGNADIIGSSLSLAVVEKGLSAETGGEYVLQELLGTLKKSYDYILIDTNPSLGVLSINSLVAADLAIIPVCPEYYAIVGLNDLFRTIAITKRRLNKNLEIGGILYTMVDSRTKLHREIMADIQKQLNGHVRIFDSYIPRSIDVSNAIRYGSGISELHKENKATIAYQSFVKELQSYGI